jgi:hypothetical protein
MEKIIAAVILLQPTVITVYTDGGWRQAGVGAGLLEGDQAFSRFASM